MSSVKMKQIVGGVGDGVLAHLTAIIVYEYVAHDCEKPTLEVDVFCELVFTVESLERGVLHEIRSAVVIGRKFICKAEEIALQADYA